MVKMDFTIREHIAGLNGLVASYGVLVANISIFFVFTSFMLFWLWRDI